MKQSHKPVFDALEDRCLQAAGLSASFHDGVLQIQGTDDNDRIVVRQIEQRISVKGIAIDINGQAQNRIPVANVTKIVILGEGGDDVMRLDQVTVASEVSGGAGNDLIFGTMVADTLNGNDGNDRIYGRRGDDFIDGGAGHDGLFGQRGDDTLVGGLGNDYVFGHAGDNAIYWNRKPPDAGTFIGMEENAARTAIEAQGYVMRVIARDGENYIITLELNTNRINVAVVNGIITEAEWEYPQGFPDHGM